MKMDKQWYRSLAEGGIEGELPSQETCMRLLTDSRVELLSLLDAAFQVRKHFHGKEVTMIFQWVPNGA